MAGEGNGGVRGLRGPPRENAGRGLMLDGVSINIIRRGYRASVAGRMVVAPSPSPPGAAVKQAALPCWGPRPVPVPVPHPARLPALRVWWGTVERGATTQTGAARWGVACPAGSCRERQDGEPQDGGADAALSGRAPSAHGWAARAARFWRRAGSRSSGGKQSFRCGWAFPPRPSSCRLCRC